MEITIQVALEFTIEVAKIYKVVEPGIPAQRATRDQEKEESASHHVTIFICFAQLRAEVCEKDSRNLWRRPENKKRTNFRTPKISTFHIRTQTC